MQGQPSTKTLPGEGTQPTRLAFPAAPTMLIRDFTAAYKPFCKCLAATHKRRGFVFKGCFVISEAGDCIAFCVCEQCQKYSTHFWESASALASFKGKNRMRAETSVSHVLVGLGHD